MNTPTLRRCLVTPDPANVGHLLAREIPAAGPAPKVLGHGRIFEGTTAPTPEQMAALFAVAPVPAAVSPAQMREWLIRAGKLDAVAGALAAIPDATTRTVMQSWWEYASEVRRDNPKVTMLAGALGLDAAAVDAAFIAAAKL